MAAISSLGIGQRLCEVLGLDSRKTQNIVISCKGDDVVRVHITQFLQDHEVTPLLNVLKDYQLEPKPDAENKKPSEDTGDTLINFMQ
jgi:hypothetical protein